VPFKLIIHVGISGYVLVLDIFPTWCHWNNITKLCTHTVVYAD